LVDPNTRQGKRTPVTLKIKFKSETLEQFIERYAVDVSQGGIFIRTKEPLAVGTQMKFEFQLRDASPLIAGEGTVVWTRENDPSRPAIAPGMGVRFDRLADGSQGILERILTEKAKQAPQRPATETAKPPLFTDTPTRVAPAPVQEALLGKDSSQRRRIDDGHNDSHTPLPKPMPFHSDADEFPDEAFEEATKVRALDELIAQTAGGAGGQEEITHRRTNGRMDATFSDQPTIDRSEPRPNVMPAASDMHEVPGQPDHVRPQARVMESGPSPRLDPHAPADTPGKTRLGVEPARARVGTPTPPPLSHAPSGSTIPPMPPAISRTPSPVPMLSPSGSELPIMSSGMRAVAAEQTEPARMPPVPTRSIAPLLILIFLLVAIGGAAGWFFFLRPQASEQRAGGPANGSAIASAPVTPQTPTSPTTGPSSGSAVPTAAPPSTEVAKAELVDTTIAASVEGATVEITGAAQSGTAPFTAKLEKGKPYKARITARGFATLELDLRGGDPKQVAKLVAKPRLIAVTSDPPGAQISLDGQSTGKTTPFDLELTAAQSAKKSVRVVLRKSGFRAIDRTIDASKFSEDDTRMLAKIDETLTPAPVATRPPPSAAGSAKPAGQGSEAGSAAAPDTAAPSPGSASEPPAPAAPAQPPAQTAPPGASGSAAEPEPDFNKSH